ncbi:STAS domain-containing protein [Pseudoalteromonas sp. SSM20]|uniref:STAS domain-containing protein n=1 Tax=unclassified Pseudoalteromonas TaxID=194690 RepID=UPI00237E34E1|nr:STAS domain-containing protein [Pseudoalteromonas sp. G4]MDE3273449.1 STAS domain-containing protein [Pseudoalteromonas sp. G4]
MNNLLPTKEQNNTLIVELPHDFSGLNVDKYREHFECFAATQHDSVVLDFSNTEFIDSSGIGAMVFLFKRIEQRGVSMLLLDVAGQPEKLMKLLRVDATIPFVQSEPAA